MSHFRIVSRNSPLAKVQVQEALGVLGTDRYKFEIRSFESYGDKDKAISLLDGLAPPDLFTRELDDELRAGKADFAVHSAKDLPLPLPPDLELYALLPSRDKTDSLVCRSAPFLLRDLPEGAKIGTSSPLRQAELGSLRPDLKIVSIRGTIEERIAQVDEGKIDALIAATCALQRLGLQHRISEVLSFETHPLQGHLAVTGLRHRSDLQALWGPFDIRRAWGRVYLVGAGPGDPDLMTIKARRLLKQADTVFHDALANPLILEETRGECVYVGKKKGQHSHKQSEINQFLYEAAIAGKAVVRLKGGDPNLFGRLSEELEYLEQRLVDVEIVPGVGSPFAASAYARIPLTERDVSVSVAFCSGYPPEKIQAPSADTLVYLMGASTLPLILEKNLESGRSPETPVALVKNASLPEQEVEMFTIASLSASIEQGHSFESPLLVILGKVVRPERIRNWFQDRPLIWYAGTNPENFPKPARILHHPLIEIRGLDDFSVVDPYLNDLSTYDWVLFTSRYTVDHFFNRLQALGLDARHFGKARVAAVGRATSKELAERGIVADLVPERESSEGLVALFESKQITGLKILLPCSDQALPVIFDGLTRLGNHVEKVVLYKNVPNTQKPEIDLKKLDEVVLTSPTTAKAFQGFFPEPPENLLITPMGEQTRRSLERLFPGRLLGPSLLRQDSF